VNLTVAKLVQEADEKGAAGPLVNTYCKEVSLMRTFQPRAAVLSHEGVNTNRAKMVQLGGRGSSRSECAVLCALGAT
jgi:hypothetical protein